MQASFFNSLMAGLGLSEIPTRLAVACSGGSDSLALTFLLQAWCQENKVQLTALIVNHGLREESAAEAESVKQQLANHDIAAIILRPSQKISIKSDIQNQARKLRYNLLTDWCQKHEVSYLAIAHHQQDQAETFLLRLARGSGVAGLSAMQAVEHHGDLMLLRPLLTVTKEELQQYLTDRNIDWVEDPSNHLDKFDRIKFRKLAPELDRLGLTSARLSKTAEIMRLSQEALDWSLGPIFKEGLQIYAVGCYRLNLDCFQPLPKALKLRCLSLLIKSASGQVYPPDLDKLEKILNLYEAGQMLKLTTHGAQLQQKGNMLWIGREISAISSEPGTGQGLWAGQRLWDGRFTCLTLPDSFALHELGAKGWSEWCRKYNKDKDDCPYPSFIRQAVPALYQGDKLLCPISPLFGVDAKEIEEKSAEFGILFKIPPEILDLISDFTFSSAFGDTM